MAPILPERLLGEVAVALAAGLAMLSLAEQLVGQDRDAQALAHRYGVELQVLVARLQRELREEFALAGHQFAPRHNSPRCVCGRSALRHPAAETRTTAT